MILDRLVNKLSSYWSWLYYRQWTILELKIALITIVVVLFVLLWWLIAWRRRKTRARIEHVNQGPKESSVISVKKGKRMKKIAIVAIIIVGLIDLGIFCYRRPKPIKGFYLRSNQTGKLIGPVSLLEDYLQPSSDEQTYIVVDPTESELEVRSRLLKSHVTVTMTDVPLTEIINHVVIPFLGNNAPQVRIEAEDESKLPRISIDASNMPLYEVLFVCASQANLRIILEDGSIILSQKEFKVR